MKITYLFGVATLALAMTTPAIANHHGDMEKHEETQAPTVMKDENGMKMVVYPEGYMLVSRPDSMVPDVIVKFEGDATKWTLTDMAGPGMCEGYGEYSTETGDDGIVSITLISDDCEGRKMALDGAIWTPEKKK